MNKALGKLGELINLKVTSIIVSILFVVSMMPNWMLAFIARPAGDDYGYSAATRQVWLQTNSLIEVLNTCIETTKSMCNVWNGDWFSVFIFTLMPEVFVYRSFWIVPIFWSLATIGATFYLFYQIFTNVLGIKWHETLLLTVLVLIMSYQWIPSSGIGLYWYVGVIHYIMPHVLALLLLGFMLRFWETKEKRYIVMSALGMIAIGGSSYYSFFLGILVYALVFVCTFRNCRHIYALAIPSITGLMALYFQVTAPGNAARVGESIGFSAGKAVNTVWQSLVQGGIRIWQYVVEKPWIVLLLILVAIIVWEAMTAIPDYKIAFRFPLLFVGYMYGVYASMFAPEIYAATEISGGPPTMEYLTFLLAAVISIAYVEGWLIVKLRAKNAIKDKEWYHTYCFIPYLLAFGLILIISKGEIKETLFYESVEYMVSGAAADYKEQILSQEKILLDDSIKEAYLCPTNDQQGPLMHMPVIDNPEAFTNRVVKQFYGKDYVIAVP